MAGCHVDLRVPGGKFPQARHVGTQDEAHHPAGDVLAAEVCRGIPAVEVPASVRFYGDATHANCMIRQGDEVHFRLKAYDADGTKLEPFFPGIVIKNEIRMMRDMPRDIRHTDIAFSLGERVIFLFVHMDFGMRKI